MASQTLKSNQSIRRVIEVVRANREVSRRLISVETGLSTPSVTRLVNELVDADLLRVNESITVEGAGPGRPASFVKINPNCGCIIGVDVGEHFIQTALSDMNDQVQAESRIATNAEQGGDVVRDNIVSGVNEVIETYRSQHGAGAPPLRAITVGVPGTIDPATSKVVNAPMIKGWSDFDLKSALTGLLPQVPLRIENDINAAAIGEYALGVAQGHDNFVFASMRRGIGAGIFIDGKLYRGNAGFAGEMGKMVWDSDFRFSSNSGLGHLESICGEDAVAVQVKKKAIDLNGEQGNRPTIRSLAQAATAGNAEAVEILDSILGHFGLAIANVCSLLDPQVIVLGGDIHFAMDMAVQRLNETIGKLVPSPPQVVGSTLGEQAVLKGTLYQAHSDACDRLLIS